MEQFNIIGALRDYCTANDWHFIYGSNDYINADYHSYKDDELVLVCEFNPTTIFNNYGLVDEIRYNGILMLGRKFETNTHSRLDETMLQKFDNRILELWQLLTNMISSFSCDNRLTVAYANGQLLINMTHNNIDFVSYNIQFIQ